MSSHAALSPDEYIQESPLMRMYEVADWVANRNVIKRCAPSVSGGVLYARKTTKENMGEKKQARRRIIDSLTLECWPGPLSILTMPGHGWIFEMALIRQRNYQGCDKKYPAPNRRTEIYSVERDQAIYMAAMRRMPGVKSHGYRQMSPHAVGCHSINCFYFTTAEDFITDPACPMFDAAWLDFTGYLNLARMQAVWEFWRTKVRWQLTITALNARYNREVMKLIRASGGIYEWITETLGGLVTDKHSYCDGHAPMIQITLQKDLRVEANEWVDG